MRLMGKTKSLQNTLPSHLSLSALLKAKICSWNSKNIHCQLVVIVVVVVVAAVVVVAVVVN